jgi:hypothetical protein
MRGLQRLGWVVLMLLTTVALPQRGRAASDGALEDRVKALERKLDQQQQGSTTETKTVTDRIDAIEKEVKDNEKTLLEKTGISVHSIIAMDYLYDINSPSNNPTTASGGPNQIPAGTSLAQPFLRTFENEKNSFILNLANLHFERTADNMPGFVIDLDFGKTGDVVNNATHFSGSPTSLGNGTDFFDARQFYITYTAPVGSGIKLKVGRFVTLAGAEVIKSYNNFNYNVTNSILFGFAIPFTHTGIMSSYAFSDQVSLDLGLVNGWDNVADNNDGKSLHSGLTLAFDPHVTFYQTVTYGPEQPGRYVTNTVSPSCGTSTSGPCDPTAQLYVHPGRSKRLLLTSLLTIKPIDPLTLIIDYDYGNDSDSVPVDGLLRTAQWQGAAAYIIYNFTDDLSACLRAEVFDDMNGSRVIGPGGGLNPTGGAGLAATYTELTPTITYKIADGLYWRNEYRHDESDSKKVFAHNANLVRGQDTIATELLYAF